MDNIFDGAKFGDKFLTRNEKIAIYHKKTPYNKHYLMVEDLLEFVPYDKAGICLGDDEWNIVSKYQEPIDEEKLDELAIEKAIENKEYMDGYRHGYSDGYINAQEE